MGNVMDRALAMRALLFFLLWWAIIIERSHILVVDAKAKAWGTPGTRRTHLSSGQPYRARLKAIKTGSKRTLENPHRIVPERLDFRISIFTIFRFSPVELFT